MHGKEGSTYTNKGESFHDIILLYSLDCLGTYSATQASLTLLDPST